MPSSEIVELQNVENSIVSSKVTRRYNAIANVSIHFNYKREISIVRDENIYLLMKLYFNSIIVALDLIARIGKC